MLARSFLSAIFLGLTLWTPDVVSQEKDGANDAAAQEKQLAALRRRFREVIDTEGLREEMPFSKFLVLLAKKGVRVHFDEAVFKGNKLKELAESEVRLPEYPKRMSVYVALRVAMSQLPDEDKLDYRILPTHVLLTSPERAIYRRKHDVGDLMPEFLKGNIQESLPSFLRDTSSGNYQVLSHGPIQILNNRYIVFGANEAGHNAIEGQLAFMRSSAEVAVLMNARLLEVDESFLDKEITPLFAKSKKGNDVIPIGEELAGALLKFTTILEGDPVRVKQKAKTHCLSFHTVVEVSGDKREGLGFYGHTLEGLTLHAAPELTATWQGMKLRLFLESSRVVALNKKKIFDLTIEKEVEVRSPVVVETKRSAVIDIPDLQYLVLRTDYLPFPAPANKRWLILLQPRIWIEEEEMKLREKPEPKVKAGAGE